MRRRQPDPIEVQQMRQEANVRRAEAEIARQRIVTFKMIAFKNHLDNELKKRKKNANLLSNSKKHWKKKRR